MTKYSHNVNFLTHFLVHDNFTFVIGQATRNVTGRMKPMQEEKEKKKEEEEEEGTERC